MEKLRDLFENTELTIEQISKEIGWSMYTTWQWIAQNYSKEVRKERKKRCYSNSKLGHLNPMFGKTEEYHHNYIGDVSDGNGYLMRIKPHWYTGRKGSKHVFVHQLVMCEALGITEIPKGFCVHHVDENKQNNDISNLALMTTVAHMRLHQLERATTSRKA